MFFYQYRADQQKIPLLVKISLIAGIILGLTFLTVFAFTFFLVIFAIGLVLFILKLFRKPLTRIYHNSNRTVQHYRPPLRDDDITDI